MNKIYLLLLILFSTCLYGSEAQNDNSEEIAYELEQIKQEKLEDLKKRIKEYEDRQSEK